MMDQDQAKDLAAVLGRIPSGIYIMTVGDGQGHETGVLCSWVQQSGFQPPSLTVAVRHDRYVNAWLTETKRAVINIVGEASKHLLGHFGRGFKADEPAFTGLDIARGTLGLPVLTDALGYLEVQLVNSLSTGDHTIYVVEILAAGAGATLHEEQPMVHIRKSGMHY